jgi:hypothetical protein
MHITESLTLPLPLIPRLTKCGNLEATVSLRVKQDEAKKRQHKAAMEKADDISMKLKYKMKELKKEEGQWRWKRAKQSRQMRVEMEAVAVMKWGTERAKKKMERQASCMTKRDIALGLRADALKKERSKLDAGKMVDKLPFFNFLFACFPFVHSTPFDACLPLDTGYADF